MLLLLICPTGAQQMCITFITTITQVRMLSDEIQRGIYISLLLVIRAEQTGGDPDLLHHFVQALRS